jgi:hypothetical protein
LLHKAAQLCDRLCLLSEDPGAFFEARCHIRPHFLGIGVAESAGANLLDAHLGAVAVHGHRADGDENRSTFIDVFDVEHLRLVQQGRHAVLELDESTDQVCALAVVVGLVGEADHRGAQAVSHLEGGHLIAQTSSFFLPGGEDLLEGDLVFVEDDAGAGLARLRRLTFVDLGRCHAGFFHEDLEGHAGIGDQEQTTFGLGGVVLAGDETVGDEAVGIAWDGDDHAAVGVVGDGGDGAGDGGASVDGDGWGLGRAGGVQFRSFKIRVRLQRWAVCWGRWFCICVIEWS